MVDTEATPRPDDMPEMVPSAEERIPHYYSTQYYKIIKIAKECFRDGVLAERARTPEPSASARGLAHDAIIDTILKFNGKEEFNVPAALMHDIKDAVAAAITSAETEARQAAIRECAEIAKAARTEAALERHKAADGEEKACWLWAFDTSNAIERDIRDLAAQPPPVQPEGWRSDMEAAKALDEDVILGRTSDIFRIVAGWDEHPDHKGFSWVAPEGQRYQDAAFNRWMQLPEAPPAEDKTNV